MKTNILATAAGLSDPDLLARLGILAGKERDALVELVAHLAELDSRPRIYAAAGYGSLFSYCTQEKLRRLQTLLRREIPDGDPAVIFDRALTLLLEKVEKKKLGAATRPRGGAVIRPGTDRPRSWAAPRAVKCLVWRRDAGQCAYVAPDGRRCCEKTFLEFHHVQAHALGGPATVENIPLRCRRHNQYEAELIFGPRRRPSRRRTRAHERAPAS
jgi:hypothetical protein